MTFNLTTILIFAGLALLYGFLLPKQWRGWALLVISLITIYWMQPALPIRFTDYILPTVTLIITALGWWVTRKPGDEFHTANRRQDAITLALIVVAIIGMSLMRFVSEDFRITPSRPPDPLPVILSLGVIGMVVTGASVFSGRMIAPEQRALSQSRLLTGFILFIILLFVILKTEFIGTEVSRWWRGQTGQDTTIANVIDLYWLGFSYVAFRLIYTLRDRQLGVLPALTLREYMTYVIFFPSFIAGPIDRPDRFAKDFRAVSEKGDLTAVRFTEGTARIAVGIFKKFVIADTLALGLALNPANSLQADSALGLWILLYGYALRLFFDFSGYSDIAIGIAILFGIKLPENFDRPYTKSDIASFWQSWHITLSNWARLYVFSPLTRALLMRKPKPSPIVIVLATQLATMLVIALWHGITVNFIIWGLWHGLGLFIHKRWSDRTRQWYLKLNETPARKRAWTVFAWVLTFHFVVLGWVWFALPEFSQAARVFAGLFGIGV